MWINELLSWKNKNVCYLFISLVEKVVVLDLDETLIFHKNE